MTGGKQDTTEKSRVPEVEVLALSKRFQDSAAVHQLSFRVWPGEFMTLLGPSGCGKTTTLRMIAGFVIPDGGRILLRGRDITDLPPYERNVGLVFQNYALFPHMSVGQNVGFGLRMQRAPKERIRERVSWALDLVRLTGLEHRRPHELSGGQQQRVAVARVLAAGASLMLLDEPFSNLDARLRRTMQLELRELQQHLRVPVIHVTHDQEEAMAMSDRLIVMNAGSAEQEGTAEEIYKEPASQFVADFIGRGNRLGGRAHAVDGRETVVRFDLDGGGTVLASWGEPGSPPERAVLFVRPEDIVIGPSGSQGGREENVLPGVVRRRVYLGPTTALHVLVNERTELLVEAPSGAVANLESSDGKVDVWLPPERVRLLAD